MQKIVKIKNEIGFISAAACGGLEESRGPLGKSFDFCDKSDLFGQKTWEMAEGEMARICLNIALKKAKILHTDVDLIAAGDLQNQCAATTLGLYSFGVPFLGLYGACSTCAESILTLAAFMDMHEELEICAAVTSSHNATAERQFRTPLEYGGQRAKTAQWTATAAGAFLLAKNRGSVRVRDFMVGRPIDGGTSDASNMGPAMAFAAADTVINYFRESKIPPTDFDLIITGDLGRGGSSLLSELLTRENPHLAKIHRDSALLIYDKERQDYHSGASGCGTSASVLAAHFLPLLEKGELGRVLFLSTGALMNSTSTLQGQNIVGIAPAVRLEYSNQAK